MGTALLIHCVPKHSIRKNRMYIIRFCSGGDEGARTPDLGIANAALSQLSYIPNVKLLIIITGLTVRQGLKNIFSPRKRLSGSYHRKEQDRQYDTLFIYFFKSE